LPLKGYGVLKIYVSVILSVREHVLGTTRPNFTKYFILFKQFAVECSFTYNTVGEQCWCNNR